MSPEPPPLYQNWSFWAVAIAVLALIISQLPPVRLLMRKARAQLDPYDRINITHGLGNPIVRIHLRLANTGGRREQILSLNLVLSVDDGGSFSLPAQTFSRPDGSPGPFLFTPFNLKIEEEWANFVSFFAFLSIADERLVKRLTEVRATISWIVRETRHLSLTELSKRLNRDISSLSVSAGRLVEKSKFDNHLSKKMEELKSAI